jgi:hypothetical protein
VFDADQVSYDETRRAVERGQQVVIQSDDRAALAEFEALC